MIGESKTSKVINNLITFHLFAMITKNMFAATNMAIQSINNSINLGIIAIFLVVYLYTFIKQRLYNRIPFFTLAIIGFLLLFFTGSIIRIPDLYANEGVQAQVRTFIAYCLPLFIICSYVEDIDGLMLNLYKYTTYLFIVASVCFVFAIQGQGDGDYSMSYGYSVLFISLLLMFKSLYYKRKADILMLVLTVFYIFQAGSRGPLLYIAMTVAALIISNKNIKRRLLYSAIVLIAGLAIFLFYRPLLILLSDILERIGISSRTLVMIANGSITDDSGRSDIHKELLGCINRSPLLGIGAFGGGYTVYLSHSIFLDAFANFGYPMGGFLLLLIFFRAAKRAKQMYNNPGFHLLLMMIVLTFGGGFMTGSFFECKEMWMLMGLDISLVINPYNHNLHCFREVFNSIAK